MGAHTDSGWDRRHLELTKRRKVLEESGVVGRVWRRRAGSSAESGGEPRSAEPGGGERGRQQSLEEESGGPPQSLEWRLGVSAVGRAAL